MQETEAQLLVPVALRMLRAAGSMGMTTEEFFATCRKMDGVDNPLAILKVLYDKGVVEYLEGKPLKVRSI